MPVYSVSQVTSYLRTVVESDALLQDIWVSGEVANLARPGSGHTYFTLREARTVLRCVMFRNARGAERLDAGGAIIAHGHLSLYEAKGDLQLIVDMVQPEGVGELQLKLEQLKLRLEKEGLFEQTRKRALPAFPRRIGVVTSPTGAVWHDIQTVIRRRYPLVELLLVPTPVQGETAVSGICEAFEALNEVADVDLIILARGGGSLEDLWAFNEEAVATAIFSSRAPVISAVGHETDYTIADLVADVRAPTPSAAAEMAVPDRVKLAVQLLSAREALNTRIYGILTARAEAVQRLEQQLRRSYPDLDDLRRGVDDLLRSAARLLQHNLEVKTGHFQGLELRLASLSPRDTLRRGYAIVEHSPGGIIISDAAQAAKGGLVNITLYRGQLEAEVTSVRATTNGQKVKAEHGKGVRP